MTTKFKFSALLVGAAACTLLSACNKEATGQVAAIVNGDEITLQEINAEIGNSNANAQGDAVKAVRQAALQRIIERRLMATAARDDGLDKTPEYLIRQRQLEDSLLVQLMVERTRRSMAVPDSRAIDRYIAEHPAMFAQREALAVDQIQFPTPADTATLRGLESVHSMDGVAAFLNEHKIPFRRGRTTMDSAQIPAQILRQISALPAGEPFVVPAGAVVNVGVIVGRQANATPADQARPLAVQAMTNERMGQTLQQRLTAARTAAKIEYQDGFAPPAGANAAGAAAPAAGAAAPATPAAAPAQR